MPVFRSFRGRELGFDWEFILQDVLANGALQVGGAGTVLNLSFGDITLRLSGAGFATSGARIIVSGDITALTLRVGGVNVIGVTDLVNGDWSDLHAMLNGAGALHPYDQAFKALIAPLVMEGPVEVIGSTGNESLLGSDLVDTINAGGGEDYVRGSGGVDVLDGGSGHDGLDYEHDQRTVGIRIDLQANAVVDNNASRALVDIISGFEWVVGTHFSDVIYGTNTGENWFHAKGGNDRIIGRGGSNFYVPGDGTDIITGGTLIGNNNWDKISYEYDDNISSGIVVTFGANGAVSIVDPYGRTDTGTSIEEVKGSYLDDIFNGNGDTNRVEGMDGDDIFKLGGGQDVVTYEFAQDRGANHGVIVNLSAAFVTYDIGTGLQTIASNKAYDVFGATDTFVSVEDINGSNFRDVLVGSSGDNQLAGKMGNDTLRGGLGADRFVFDTYPDETNNVDTIVDFRRTQGDKIVLAQWVFGEIDPLSALAAGAFRANATGVAMDADDRIVYNTTTGELTYFADGNLGGDVIQFAVLTGSPGLTAADFEIWI